MDWICTVLDNVVWCVLLILIETGNNGGKTDGTLESDAKSMTTDRTKIFENRVDE